MDIATFGAKYDETVRSIYGFLYYKTFRREVAEDLTSTTYLKALERLSTFTDRGDGSFQAWLYTIARNTYADYVRRAGRTAELPDNLPEMQPSAQRMEAAADLSAVVRELHKLPEAQRDIIVLRVWQDLSYKEIGAILGKSEDSCKVAFSRAIHSLRSTLL